MEIAENKAEGGTGIGAYLLAHLREYGLLFALIAIMGFFEIVTDGTMLRAVNMTNLFLQNSYIIIMALGILMIRDIFRETSIVWVSAVRFAIASLVMLLWARLKFPKAWTQMVFVGFQRRDTWKTMIPMSFFGPFVATLFWMAGFKHSDAGRAIPNTALRKMRR